MYQCQIVLYLQQRTMGGGWLFLQCRVGVDKARSELFSSKKTQTLSAVL